MKSGTARKAATQPMNFLLLPDCVQSNNRLRFEINI
jgi:hypothetical protein